jgi:ribonuclease HI
MEYEALLYALEMIDCTEIFTDSQLLVGHLTKGWKVKAKNLYPYFCKCSKLLQNKNIKLTWIPRKENRAGHLLE